jgi:hypothetical protein
MNTVYLNSDFTKGRIKIEYEDTLEMLENFQTFLDKTTTPSEAIDALYTAIMQAKRDINAEMNEVLYND